MVTHNALFSEYNIISGLRNGPIPTVLRNFTWFRIISLQELGVSISDYF